MTRIEKQQQVPPLRCHKGTVQSYAILNGRRIGTWVVAAALKRRNATIDWLPNGW